MDSYIIDLMEASYLEDIPPATIASLNITRQIKNKVTTNVALISKRGKNTYVTIRSTKSARNVLEDLWAYPMVQIFGGYKFHPGFYLSFLSIWQQIVDELKNQNVENLVVSGHSMGASVAGIASVHFISLGYKVVELNLLACPKFGSRNTCKLIEQHIPTVNNFLNGDDVIWYVSPGASRPHYKRIGNPKWWKPFSIQDHMLIDHPPKNQGYRTSLQKGGYLQKTT